MGLFISVPGTSLSAGDAKPPPAARCGVSALPLLSRWSLRALHSNKQGFLYFV